MKCPVCNSPVASQEHLPTGDWFIRYECDRYVDDNGLVIKCEKEASIPPQDQKTS